jgi:hypothetical protein
MTDQERIEKEAQEAADSFDIRGCAAHQGYLRGYIAGSKKVEELREVVRELLPIAEEHVNLAYLKLSDQHYPREFQIAKQIQAIIDRAKKLV